MATEPDENEIAYRTTATCISQSSFHEKSSYNLVFGTAKPSRLMKRLILPVGTVSCGLMSGPGQMCQRRGL